MQPNSRLEAIVQSMIDGTPYTAAPLSRLEAELLRLKAGIDTDMQQDEEVARQVENLDELLDQVRDALATNTEGDSALAERVTLIEEYLANMGTGSDPDGTMAITRDTSGNITQIVFTEEDGTIETTTFTSTTITKRTVKPDATVANVQTTTKDGDTVTVKTTEVPL